MKEQNHSLFTQAIVPIKNRTCYSVLCYHINVETYVAYAVPGHFVHYLYETNTFKGVIIP